MKKRILCVGEATFLNTGFSVIGKYVLDYLHKTEKYEIAEIGNYSNPNDPRIDDVPWKFYPNVPTNQVEEKEYQAITGQFGSAIFERVCLEFKPDIVLSWTDHWMYDWQIRSPVRNMFKHIVMPCIDSEPQKANWLDDFKQADLLLAYARYANEVLERQSLGKIKTFDIVMPAVDHEVFVPKDKSLCRQKLGIPQDANVILTVMRNQRRKLFPDLIEMFSEYLERCPKEQRDKTILHLHTSYPDVGFDINRHIVQCGVSNKVIVTYICANCKRHYADKMKGDVAVCKNCREHSAHCPNTQNGLSREELSEVYGAADLYIQYSIAGAIEMPIAEAKSCEVPAFGVDYAAMSEQVEVEGCQKIKVAKFFHEPITETEQVRALPDNDDCINKIINFFNATKEQREKWGKLARQDVIEKFSMERAAKVFEKAIDSVKIEPHDKTWLNKQPNFSPNVKNVPPGMTPSELVDWCITNILGEKRFLNTYWRQDIARSVSVGYTLGRAGREPFSGQQCIDYFRGLAAKKDYWERKRLEIANPPTEEEKGQLKWLVV